MIALTEGRSCVLHQSSDFAAVERYENPGVGLNYPYETILQKEDLKEDFWLKKNAEYVARLKQSPDDSPNRQGTP